MLIAATFLEQVSTLILGFALTTVIGGALGSWFQRRAWDHQNDRSVAEADRAHAMETFRELSELMDKRLYRMWQAKWALFAEDLDEGRVERRMDDYRAVLVEWNDSLMRNLASTEIEFGPRVRQALEGEVYEEFAAVGRRLEARYRDIRGARREPTASEAVSKRLSQDLLRLRGQVYRLNVRMLKLVRDGRVGRRAPADAREDDAAARAPHASVTHTHG